MLWWSSTSDGRQLSSFVRSFVRIYQSSKWDQQMCDDTNLFWVGNKWLNAELYSVYCVAATNTCKLLSKSENNIVFSFGARIRTLNNSHFITVRFTSYTSTQTHIHTFFSIYKLIVVLILTLVCILHTTRTSAPLAIRFAFLFHFSFSFFFFSLIELCGHARRWRCHAWGLRRILRIDA